METPAFSEVRRRNEREIPSYERTARFGLYRGWPCGTSRLVLPTPRPLSFVHLEQVDNEPLTQNGTQIAGSFLEDNPACGSNPRSKSLAYLRNQIRNPLI